MYHRNMIHYTYEKIKTIKIKEKKEKLKPTSHLCVVDLKIDQKEKKEPKFKLNLDSFSPF